LVAKYQFPVLLTNENGPPAKEHQEGAEVDPKSGWGALKSSGVLHTPQTSY